MQIAPSLSVLRALGSSLSPPAPTRPGSCGAPCGSQRAEAAHAYGGPGAGAATRPPEASERATWVSRPRVDILV